MIIPLCSAPVAVVNVGPKKTGGSINAIAGDQRASMARPRLGMDLRGAVRRGLANMKIQSYLTAAAINLNG